MAVWIERRQGFVEDPRGVQVLLADSKMRIEQRRGLPPQQPQHATAAALQRFVVRGGLCSRDARPREQLARQWGSHPDTGHDPVEAAPRELSAPDRVDQAAQVVFTHGFPLPARSLVHHDPASSKERLLSGDSGPEASCPLVARLRSSSRGSTVSADAKRPENFLPARPREGQSGGPVWGPSMASRTIGTGGEP